MTELISIAAVSPLRHRLIDDRNMRHFTHTLDRPDLARRLVRVSHPRKIPVVLSRDEVSRLLHATTCLKHQAALSVAVVSKGWQRPPHPASVRG
jgi:hypothetical protein